MTLMVMAKPSAGRILPVMANALVVHCGRLLMIRPTASAPKYRAKNIGIANTKNSMMTGHHRHIKVMPLVLQVLAY